MKKIVVSISGASGASLGLKVLSLLPKGIQKHLIISDHAKIVLDKEQDIIVHDEKKYCSIHRKRKFQGGCYDDYSM